MSKVHKEQGVTSLDISPRGEGPLTRQIKAPLGAEKKDKTHIKSTPNGVKLCKTHLKAQ
jgi:hypothetical protein